MSPAAWDVARKAIVSVAWLALAYVLVSPVTQAMASLLSAAASDIKDPIGFGGLR